ncbi:MAG: sigma 54-interacting transcriptional regulator [Nannocystaceae bacterium]|nr:sigma-54-dependent Fis family transcriptional regulator [Myxococcales bacterium]
MDESTLIPDDRPEHGRPLARLALTIVFHPDVARVGERAWFDEFATERVGHVSRTWPLFHGAAEPRPLAEHHVSRRPLRIAQLAGGGVQVSTTTGAAALRINGALVLDERLLSREELRDGAVLELASRIVLLLHEREEVAAVAHECGLVGDSPEIRRLRRELLVVAELPIPVLLRGESGTGKELAARAIHAASQRASRPCVCVNMAALTGQTAVAELFGYTRGAFTGAVRPHEGYFRDADGGTLFLDEIGETPPEVQLMLLRVLETGEIQPLGGGATRPVDVRLLAATDTNLEHAVARGRFRLSLLHRLASYEIWLPPLRARKEDIARLLVHFLRKELRLFGDEDKLEPRGPHDAPWLPAEFVAKLVRYPWPGNVRQLINLARQIAVSSQGAAALSLPAAARRLVEPERAHDLTAPASASAEPSTHEPPSPVADDVRRRAPSELTEDELVAALRVHAWRISATARHLGISKTSLYALIEQCPRIRKARDLTREELAAASARCNGSIERMSAELEVSIRGLQLRMRELGL